MRSQSLGWMNESDRDYFLSAIRSGDGISFGTVREAEKWCIVQECDIKPRVEPPMILSFNAYIERQDMSSHLGIWTSVTHSAK